MPTAPLAGQPSRGGPSARRLALEVDLGGVGLVRTDPGLVRQVLNNLLGNALKFTDDGTVRVRARREPEHVLVEVEDSGPGIAPEHQERVFEAFFQVDPSTTRKEGGTGLGLALSRDFA